MRAPNTTDGFLQAQRLANVHPSQRLATVLASLGVVALIGCTSVRLIGDYDATIDQGVSDVQQKAEIYFAKLKSTPTTPYDPSVYDDLHGRLAVLKSRAASLPKYGIIADQIGNLQKQVDDFQSLDQGMTRPIAAQTVTNGQSGIAVSVESILKLELALKRGEDPPGAATRPTVAAPAQPTAAPQPTTTPSPAK